MTINNLIAKILKRNNFIAEILKINNLTPDELPESKEFNRNFENGGYPIIFFQQSPNQNIHFHEHWCTFHLKSYKEKKIRHFRNLVMKMKLCNPFRVGVRFKKNSENKQFHLLHNDNK
jgi:hypothetical protein